MILKNGKRVDGCSDTLPVGTVQPFLGLTPPLGYLVCQGQQISKAEYPELYAICGDTFGASTDTHFYLPDLRGKTIAGFDNTDGTMNTIGKLLGEKTHTHTSAAHTHTVAAHGHTVNNSNAYNSGGPSNNTSGGPSNNTSGSTTLTAAQSGVGNHTHTVYDGSRADQISFAGFYASSGTTMRYKPAYNGLTDNIDACLKNTYTSANASQGHTHTLSSHTHSLQSHTHSIGAHNHGLTTTALTTDSTTPGATGSNTNFQPTVVLNWIVKAVMLIPDYFVVENTLTSTSTSNALSAAQGKILNNKFNNYLPVGGTAKFAEALPGFDYFENNEQAWGNQIGECLYRADSPSGGSIALRGDNPGKGQLSLIIDGFFYQQEGNYRCLDVSDLGNYAFYKFPQFEINSSTPSVSHSLQITGKGRPIFVSITGDLNSFSEGGSWIRITLKRNNVVLATQIAQGGSLSQNIPFAINYLDQVGAGTYTYSVHFERGGNDSTFGEENGHQTPNFLVYEI